MDGRDGCTPSMGAGRSRGDPQGRWVAAEATPKVWAIPEHLFGVRKSCLRKHSGSKRGRLILQDPGSWSVLGIRKLLRGPKYLQLDSHPTGKLTAAWPTLLRGAFVT